MFEGHRRKAAVLFALADVILTVLAFEAAYHTRVVLPLERVFFLAAPTKALLLGTCLAVGIGVGWWLGVYSRLYASNLRAVLSDTFVQVAFMVVGLITFQYLLRLDVSRMFIGLVTLYALVILLVYRIMAGQLRGYIRRQFGAESNYVVVGTGQQAVDIAWRLRQAWDHGVRLLAVVSPDRTTNQAEPGRMPESLPAKTIDELPGMLRSHSIDEIIFAVDRTRLEQLEDLFLLCDEEGVRTRFVIDFFPHVHSQVYMDRFGDLPLLTFSGAPHDEVRLFAKRIFDICLASTTLLLLALPMGLLCMAVRLTSKGPAIFRQIRCGLGGREFVFYKLRSMVADAEAQKERLAHLNEKDGPAFKISDDPRLTSMGRYLRRFSIDEWPQLWNILRGDMSFVGPRPAVPSEVDQYKSWQRRRLRVRPGLTCLWTLQGRDRLDFETWMRLDLEYIDNWSFWLDVKILARSIPYVLAGRGAH